MSTPFDPTLGEHGIARVDSNDDALFYSFPRMVVHIDDGAIARVNTLISQLVQPGSRLLDLMSSVVSHLPADFVMDEVVGLGMNAEEMTANPALNRFVVHDLNVDSSLPFENDSFGAALCTVSVQYLTRPTAVFAEVGRVLRSGGPFLVTFSNRCFPTKAIRAWHERDDAGHVELVSTYFREAGCWSGPEVAAHIPPWGDPLFAVWAVRS